MLMFGCLVDACKCPSPLVTEIEVVSPLLICFSIENCNSI